MIGRRTALLAFAAAFLAPEPARAADPSGNWLTEGGDAVIRIGRCGSALCGRIAALSEPRDPETGRPKTDEYNRNEQLRKRPLIGVQIVIRMTPNGRPGQWVGKVYNPEDGGIYPAKMTMTGPHSLRLEGCIVPDVMCNGQTWSRAR